MFLFIYILDVSAFQCLLAENSVDKFEIDHKRMKIVSCWYPNRQAVM